MLDKLSHAERLQLMRFVCSFAWADLVVKPKEQAFVRKLIKKLGLNEDEKKKVLSWLVVPPETEALDPMKIPREHRQIFLDAARQMIEVDGDVDPEETETLRLLEALTR